MRIGASLCGRGQPEAFPMTLASTLQEGKYASAISKIPMPEAAREAKKTLLEEPASGNRIGTSEQYDACRKHHVAEIYSSKRAEHEWGKELGAKDRQDFRTRLESMYVDREHQSFLKTTQRLVADSLHYGGF